MSKLYRKNVGIIVCKKGKVLLFARANTENFSWQFPQGGIEDNENLIEAGKRELYEETGIKNIKFIKKMPFSVKYDFPKNIKNPYLNKYAGQEQYWLLFEFLGDDNEIKFDNDQNCIEFKDFRWDNIDIAYDEIIDFKKECYEKVIKYFKPFVEETSK